MMAGLLLGAVAVTVMGILLAVPVAIVGLFAAGVGGLAFAGRAGALLYRRRQPG